MGSGRMLGLHISAFKRACLGRQLELEARLPNGFWLQARAAHVRMSTNIFVCVYWCISINVVLTDEASVLCMGIWAYLGRLLELEARLPNGFWPHARSAHIGI